MVLVSIFPYLYLYLRQIAGNGGKGALEGASLDWLDVIIIGGLRRVFVSPSPALRLRNSALRAIICNKMRTRWLSSVIRQSISWPVRARSVYLQINLFRVIVKVGATNTSA